MSQSNTDMTQTPSLTIDWEAYLPFLEDEDIPEHQKRELIEALWGIVTAFVDMGFGVHPTQQSCGEQVNIATDVLADMLSCDQPETINSNAAASQFGKAAGKESE